MQNKSNLLKIHFFAALELFFLFFYFEFTLQETKKFKQPNKIKFELLIKQFKNCF